MEVPRCPVTDCTIPVDLVLQSSSGEKIGAHKHNLQTYGDGFPLSDSVVTDADVTNDIPVLSERTEVIHLMLWFMHHVPQPNLQKLPFDTVAQFADAAEKYFIYSAIGVCKIYMSTKVKDHPAAVFGYACKHRYEDIANQAAPLTLNLDVKTVSEFLGPNHMLLWFQYRECYLENFRAIYSHVPPIVGLHKGGVPECDLWAPFELAVLRRVLKLTSLVGLEEARDDIINDEMEALEDCAHCTRRAGKWKMHGTGFTNWAPRSEFGPL